MVRAEEEEIFFLLLPQTTTTKKKMSVLKKKKSTRKKVRFFNTTFQLTLYYIIADNYCDTHLKKEKAHIFPGYYDFRAFDPKAGSLSDSETGYML
jgi:hypothetical protein